MFKAVVSTQDGEAFQKEVDSPAIIGLTIGEEIDGSLVGLTGYRLEITGGTDSDGFPMRGDQRGTGRTKVLLSESTGYRGGEDGSRSRKTVRGNTISEDIEQINFKVTEEGDQPVPEAWGLAGEEETTEESGGDEEEEETEEEPEEKEDEEPDEEESKQEEETEEPEEQEKQEEDSDEGQEETEDDEGD